jgi:molecular chaperone DnaK
VLFRSAAAHATEDKKRRELVETRNQGEALAHSTERMLKEHGDKLQPADRSNIESEIGTLRTALAGDTIQDIKASMESLSQAAMKLGEVIYQAGPEGQAGPGGAQQGPGGSAHDDVVDADFEEVDDKKNRSA